MIDITRRRLPYVLMDVFTDHPLEGNQLAIFTTHAGSGRSKCKPSRAKPICRKQHSFFRESLKKSVAKEHVCGSLLRRKSFPSLDIQHSALLSFCIASAATTRSGSI